jgi:MFS family permease
MPSPASPHPVRRLLVLSLVARLPLTMLSLALLVHARALTGSFAAAGLVAGVYAAAVGVGGPLLGALVDRRGQAPVLLASAVAAAGLLAAVAVAPVGTPLPALLALAAGIGLASPPVGACLRTLLPALLDDAAAVRRAYALEATASELTWVIGPPLALAAAALWSTGAALAGAGLVLVVATTAFALQPASRRWQPRPRDGRRGGVALRTSALRRLVTMLAAVGVLFGAVEVGVTAAAAGLSGTGAAAPLLALWGAGSLLGGLLATRLGGGPRGAGGLAALLVALALGHLALVPVAGSLAGIGVVLLLAGAAIAPTYSTVYAMVGDAAPAGTATEAFAWLGTAVSVGAALGAAAAGSACAHVGPAAAFALAGAAGLVAVLLAFEPAWVGPRRPVANTVG